MAGTHIAMATIGTQGDVQPFVALGLALKAAGYRVTLATSVDFEPFVTAYGLDFLSLGAHVQDFLRQSLFENAMSRSALFNAPTLLRQGYQIIETATRAAWPLAQEADALILNMNTSFGVDFAEALGIPAIMVAPQPLTATRDYPLCIYAGRSLGGTLNRMSYALMQLQQSYYNLPRNRLRAELMNLPRRRNGGFFRGHDGAPLPVLYCYSPHVSPRPADWPATATVTGYFRLADLTGWEPTPEFRQFLASGPPPVYVGFGSMPFGAERNTAFLSQAFARWGGRAVVARGWGGIDPKALPGSVFAIEKAPHDKLFAMMGAVVHHGGAGTTAAGLTAGKPTFVMPQTVDQPFWGARVHALGAGPEPQQLRALTPDRFAAILDTLVSSPDYAARAGELGEKLRAETGTANAVAEIGRILSRTPAVSGLRQVRRSAG